LKMRTFKARGIVLKEFINGESDKLITALTFEYGKLRINARGAAKPSCKFHASARLFVYSDYVIYNGGGFYSLNQGEPILPFDRLARNYVSLCYASYFAELTEKTVLEGENCDEILRLLLYALKCIEKEKIDIKLLRTIFEFKFMQLCGFTPNVDACVICGGKADLTHFGEFGFVCGKCAENHEKLRLAKISETAVFALQYILTKSADEVFSFALSQDAQTELHSAAVLFLGAHSDVYLKSTAFLD